MLASTINQILIEKSVIQVGKNLRWKLLEIINDNCIIVCSIENVDPMGVHTGDSITVAPCP